MIRRRVYIDNCGAKPVVGFISMARFSGNCRYAKNGS